MEAKLFIILLIAFSLIILVPIGAQDAFAKFCSRDSQCGETKNECTDKKCVLGVCVKVPLTGNSCGNQSSTQCSNPNKCVAGFCSAKDKLSGTNCDSGKVCRGGACDGFGSCIEFFLAFNTPCGDPSSGQCDNRDICKIGVCIDNFKLIGTSCNDGNVCTGSDLCNGFGQCTGLPKSGTACGDPSSGQCDGADICNLGDCQSNNQLIGTACDDGNVCTVSNECNGLGSCVGFANTGNACGDQSSDQCDNADKCVLGVCKSNNKLPGTLCGDSSDTVCDKPDTCSGTGLCNVNFEPDGLSCLDGTVCNGPEACQSGTCTANAAPDCDDTNECTANSCNAVTGCANTNIAFGIPCSIGICDGAGMCVPKDFGTDRDNDGIFDTLDLLPFAFSNDFSDGATFGTITSGNAVLEISDNPGNGVHISSTGVAFVDACGNSSLSLSAGDSTNVSCGSVTIEVVSGMIDVEFVGDDGTTVTATLTEGDDVTFEQDTLIFTNEGENPVTLIVNGEEQTILPGESSTLITEIIIDIKPGSEENPINLKSEGVISVAVLSTDSFDATTLDVETMTFGPNDATESHNKLHIEDVNGDGLDDVVLHFKTQDIGVDKDTTSLEILGQTVDGVSVKGTGDVIIKGSKIKEN